MSHYIAIIHKDENSCFGVSFPDVRGVFTAGDTLDEAIRQARDVLAFAAETWEDDTGSPFPKPRSIDELRSDTEFVEDSAGAILAAVPFKVDTHLVAAE
jgi:predicted RNase H-like HicB family nuclease